MNRATRRLIERERAKAARGSKTSQGGLLLPPGVDVREKEIRHMGTPHPDGERAPTSHHYWCNTCGVWHRNKTGPIGARPPGDVLWCDGCGNWHPRDVAEELEAAKPPKRLR